LLNGDYEEKMCKFKVRLQASGYSEERVVQFIHLACFGTIWEAELPPPIKNRGDYFEWMKIAPRSR
jgi:hypothetical protein